MSKTKDTRTKFIGSDEYKATMTLAKNTAHKNMRLNGRKNWNEADYEMMSKTFFRIMQANGKVTQ